MNTTDNNKEQLNAQQLNKLFQQDVFKILNEPIRIEIIKHLAIHGPSDISTIASYFEQDRSVISRHLKMMKESGVLIMTKASRRSIYQVDGMEFLSKMESVVEDIKEILRYTCKDTFDYLYSKEANYKSYLEQLEDSSKDNKNGE